LDAISERKIEWETLSEQGVYGIGKVTITSSCVVSISPYPAWDKI